PVCVPKTATVACAGATCGSASDGCGGTVSCGGDCACVPGVCPANSCGSFDDGCGGSLTCSSGCVNSCTNAQGTALDPVARNTYFGPGSLIIPMDYCFQPDAKSGNYDIIDTPGECVAPGTTPKCYATYKSGDTRGAFGMLYLLAINNIPVSIILNQTKSNLGDDDFVITPTNATTDGAVWLDPSKSWAADPNGINAISGGVSNPLHYNGMPFVVDASFANQAIKVLQNFTAKQSGVIDGVNVH